MTDEQKATLEHLAKLADDRWREYDHKSQAEWKLCYALWAALLAASSVLLSNLGSIKAGAWQLLIGVAIFGGFLLILHVSINNWLHERMGQFRDQLNLIVKRRAELLNIPLQLSDDKSNTSLGFQTLVTLALVILLVCVAALKFVKDTAALAV